MRRTQRRALAALAVPTTIVSLAAMSGCTSASTGSATSSSGGGASNAASTAARGGAKDVLTLGATADMYGWDPANQPGYQNWAGEAVWDTLARCNAVGELTPDIAQSWTISKNNKTFTAKIRPGMKFSDGTPVNAAAVKASFDYVAHNGGSTADYKGITFASPDPNTIAITWPTSQQVMANKICSPKIMPASYLAAKKWDNPVSSGPYVLDTSATTTGSVYTFTKRADYWDAANYPYKKLVIKIITSNTAVVSALKTGQIDASLVDNGSAKQVKSSGLDVIQFQGQSTRLIISDHLGKKIKALGDVRVRQAMNMVFDKQAMASRLYLGNATPTPQVFRKGTPAYIDGLADPYPYDVAKAKQLMAAAGYANGFTLKLPTMQGQNFETLMPYVKQQLAQINIKVTEVPLSGANAIGNLLSGTYPVVLWQLGNLGNSALQIYIEDTPAGWWDLEHQPDQYVDSRWTKMATASPEESKTLQQEINRYIVDQAWFAPMVYTGTNYAYNAKKVSIPTESDQEALTPKLRDFK